MGQYVWTSTFRTLIRRSHCVYSSWMDTLLSTRKSIAPRSVCMAFFMCALPIVESVSWTPYRRPCAGLVRRVTEGPGWVQPRQINADEQKLRSMTLPFWCCHKVTANDTIVATTRASSRERGERGGRNIRREEQQQDTHTHEMLRTLITKRWQIKTIYHHFDMCVGLGIAEISISAMEDIADILYWRKLET